MTEKALQLLAKNDQGFFLMVEAGQIDWACHNSDAGTALHEMLALDATVKTLLEWVEQRDDTLLVITADHETGAFGFSYSGRDVPLAQKLPGTAFAGVDFQPNFNFGSVQILDRLYEQKQSFYMIFRQFDALPADQQTPQRLQELVKAAMPFQITTAEAEAILTRGPNPIFREGHPYLGSKTLPKIRDYAEFFVYGENLRMNLLGRALATDQNIVWGTGTHSATPVVVVAVGPDSVTRPFGRMMHATQLGKAMHTALMPD
jgi:alkaline phosphatase